MPDWKVTVECGCTLKQQGGETKFDYCPMHKAAPTYKAALEEIRRDEGRVCEEYELCRHTSCGSSYGAWAIADKALRPPE